MLDDFSEISVEEAICQDRSSNDLVPGLQQHGAQPDKSRSSQEISESLMKIEDSSKQVTDSQLLGNITPVDQSSSLVQIEEAPPIPETEEQAHQRKTKLFEMALSSISAASLRFSVAPAQDT